MYRVNNSARDTRTRTFPLSAWTIIKLAAICLVTAAVPFALYVRVDSKDSKAAVTVRAAGKGGPYLNLQNKHEMRVDYRGDQNVIQAMRSGQVKPRTLASADLDGDSSPDLLAGYRYGGMGIVTIQRGNPEAFAPKDESVFLRMQQGYNPSSLLPTAQTYQVPEPADFLQAGDFNNDSRNDVLVGTQGRDLFLLAGDGHGNLAEPVQISLPGVVTAMAAGQFRAPDGRTDLAVGIDGPSGPQVLIYDGANGVTSEPMRFALASPATALEFGEMDASPFMGLAIATGSEISVIHGWGRKQSPKLESRVERIDTGMNVRGLASGFFIWSRESTKQLAALGDDGTIRIFGRGELNTQPFTDLELTARGRLRLQQKKTTPIDVETLSGWQAAKAERWTTARELVTGNFVGADPTARNLLRGADVSFADTDDLLVLGSRKLDIIRQIDTAKGARLNTELNTELVGGDFTTTSLEQTEAPATVLAMPQKVNGYRDLLVMGPGNVAAIVAPLAPTVTITVDRIDDPNGGALAAASVCGVGAGDCSLRGAVQYANANPGTQINFVGSNTYTLNTNGTGGCVIESTATGNTIGDLEVNETTIFMGNGAGSTIINQIGTGNGGTYPGDRVLCMNVTLAPGRTYSFTGMTIAGGRDGGTGGGAVGSGIGGGGFIGGAKDTTLNLTDVTFANNQTFPASVGQGPMGGGALSVQGGNVNVLNCTFGAANNPGASRTSLTLGNAANSLSGGGISYSPGASVNGATGTLEIDGTTFTHNTSTGSGGGGLDVLEGNVSVGTANISTSTFTFNQAQNGGGLFNESLNFVNIDTTSFTSNAATNRGGGLYVAGGLNTHLNGTAASITFSNNTATTAGSSISAAGAVTVSGTNTIVGGDLEITTNGFWTNNAGSVISPTNFIMTGTANFTGNNSTTNVAGNFNFGSGTFNAGTGLFNFNGTTPQSITNGSLITFNNLTDSNTTHPLTLNNSFNVNGTLNINGASAFFAPVASAVIGGTGTLTGTGEARVTRTGANSFFSQYTMPNRTLTNLTVDYIGAAAQTASATTYGKLTITNGSGVTLAGNTIVDGLLILQTGALDVSTHTLTINNGTSVGTGSLTSAAAGTVIYNQGSAGQSVLAANYGHLTFSAFTKLLPSSGIIGVAGTFNPNGVTTGHTIAGSTFDFNGTGAQTVPLFNYHNLTISGARGGAVVTLPAGTINVAGAFSHTATGLGTAANIAAAIAGNTVVFNGSVAQTIGGTTTMTFNNLTLSNPAGVTGFAGTMNVVGNWLNNFTFNPNGGTVRFNGSSGTQIVSGNTTFHNLTIDNAGAAIAFFAPNTTVANTLSKVAGAPMDPASGTFTFTGGAGSIIGASTKTFYNLVINAGATISNNSGGNITVENNFTNNGTFTQGSGLTTTFDNSVLVHNFAGGGATTFGSVIINSGTAIDAGSHSFNVQGANLTATGTFTGNTGTVTFIGTVAQTIGGNGAKNFNNLTINNGVAGTVTSGSSPSVAGTLLIQSGTFTTASNFNNVQINSGATLAGTNLTTMNVTGTWTNNGGTFTGNGNTVNFNGAALQTIAGTGTTTFDNLTNANANGISMTNDNTVNNILALTSSDITVAATKTLTQPVGGTSTGTWDVNGRVQRTGFVSLACPTAPCANTLSFGNPDNQITITLNLAPANIVVDLTRTVPTGFTGAVQRYYTITPSATGSTFTLRLRYLQSELNTNVEGPNFIFRRFNGVGWAPIPPTTSDFVNNWLEKAGQTEFSPWTFDSKFSPTAADGTVTGRITDGNGVPVEGAVVRLSGVQNRKIITDANGVYRFEQVETGGFYTVTPSRANYTFSPASRSFSQTGQTTDAAFDASATNSGLVNPLDTPEYFVRQNYLDFLGREPDEAGFNFWSNEILGCGGDAGCVDRKRTNVSAAYFLSIEFQQTGGLVDGLYRASFARRPSYLEFKPDAAAVAPLLVVGSANWEQTLENGKTAFLDAFVQRAAFRAAYDGMSNDAYVDALITNTGAAFTSAERNALVNGLAGGMTRATVLRAIVEDADAVAAKRNEAFVMMEYFGYLRREPDAVGYTYWLDKLNHFNGNFEQAEMVRAFIISDEYRNRFPR